MYFIIYIFSLTCFSLSNRFFSNYSILWT